jgi:hypothetical protein
MALDFTIVVNVRHQFGDTDQNIGVFAGSESTFSFDCPSVSSDQALLLFQSLNVSGEQVLEINGVLVFGGVPATDEVIGFTGEPQPANSAPFHSHGVTAFSLGWVGNVLIINPGVLRENGNTMRIASAGDKFFVIDNVIVLYKVRKTGPVIGGGLTDHP